MTKSKDRRRRKNEGQVKELGKEIEGLAGQRTEELSVLKDIASAVNRPLALDQMLKAVTEAVLETVPSAQRVVIHLCSEAASILVPIASAQRGRSRKRTPPVEIIQTIARRAAKKKQRIYIPDLRKEARAPDQKGELSLLIVPLVSDRKTVGTLSVYGAGVEAFTDHDQCLVELFAGWAAIAIKKTQLRFEAEQSQEAALTVLANQAASA
ncbi:MAG: GAF domain-containing protein [Armatimonadetes bacterium]|nr:GAF domain-containing protein [Armatimonadota bacterium]NIM23099.1 GAF domain-containing protein [Armatimonadota bacterium]NIM75501.1 GAF domain-containing protein [Armatimonadota bacterium]NIO96217.1 GAF domain-containing protein [Armatimonadota bacterium]NIT30505.1 GAF domain-containing protein [Armatimonadota bacterium]